GVLTSSASLKGRPHESTDPSRNLGPALRVERHSGGDISTGFAGSSGADRPLSPVARGTLGMGMARPAVLVCSALGGPALLRHRRGRGSPRRPHYRCRGWTGTAATRAQSVLVLGRSLSQSRVLGLLLLT